MNIILTCVGKFQEYILENITQLLALGHTSIYVITDRKFFGFFGGLCLEIILIDVAELPDTYEYTTKSLMDKSFREAFWVYTSARFFYIYECMRKYNIEDVIHIENDVVIYYNVNVLEPLVDKSRIYMPFDSYSRNIASIVYIPNHKSLSYILDKYDMQRNDMYNFGKHIESGKVDTFPIFANKYGQSATEEKYDAEKDFVTKNYARFPYLFDAAAMGQYLGGIDPLNKSGDTRGFVNATTVIQYDKYKFVWSNHITQTDIYQPFLYVADNEADTQLLPIFNLHIHSKTINRFTSKSSAPFYNTYFTYHSNVGLVNHSGHEFGSIHGMSSNDMNTQILMNRSKEDKLPYTTTPDIVIHAIDNYPFVSSRDTNINVFDVVIPVGPCDVSFLEKHVQYIQQNVMGFRNIYLIVYDDTIKIPGCITISESVFPFSKSDILFPSVHIGKVLYNRDGWYLQQLLKIYSMFVIPNILENILIIDADTVFLRPTHFIQNNKFFYGYSSENHLPYFKHAAKLHPSFTKNDPNKSGIVHYMMFQRKYLKKIMDMVEQRHENPFWRVFLDQVDTTEGSSASEYELYFNYMLRMFPDKIELRELPTSSVSSYNDITTQHSVVVSCHAYKRK